MRAGHLRRRIAIQALTEGTDAAGGPTRAYTTFATVWAALEPSNGRESDQADAYTARVTTKITIRYLTGLVPTMRVLYGTRTFNILGVIDVEERHETMVLQCEEGPSNGS